MNEDRTGRLFDALADPTRRTVMRMLSEQGPQSATELANELPVTRQAVAKHLASLVDAGLVEIAELEGREKRYRLTPAPLADAAWWMASLDAQWEERLERLRTQLGRSGEGRRRTP
jgi:ArsR family transcriptional regulator, cadmium/lead-responsive transcriptional repressor